MKTLLTKLTAALVTALLVGLVWLIPHSPFSVTLEFNPTPASGPGSVLAAAPAGVALASPTPANAAPILPDIASLTPTAAPTDFPTPAPDPYGELYFTLVGFGQPDRLVRLPGACVVGLVTCPPAETVSTPFDMRDVFHTKPEGIAWSRDGRYGLLITHPEDELSRGHTQEELDRLQKQSPADFQIATSTIYLLEAETDTWRELHHAERKFIHNPVWSADGQWIAFAVRGSLMAFHPIQADDGIYLIRPDGSGLTQLASTDSIPLGWVGGSVALQHTISPYPATNYAIELLSLNGQITPLFTSTRVAYYHLAPDGGALLVTDGQGQHAESPQKSVDLLALDGNITHTFGSYPNTTQSIWVTDWSADSSLVAYANLRRVYIAPRDGAPREIYTADDTYVQPTFWNMQFSPDQKHLLADVYDGTPRLVTISLESGQSSELVWADKNPDDQAHNFSWKP